MKLSRMTLLLAPALLLGACTAEDAELDEAPAAEEQIAPGPAEGPMVEEPGVTAPADTAIVEEDTVEPEAEGI